MTDLQHLNDLFAASEDPWHTRSGWFAERKHAVLLACLAAPRYNACLEPGCGDGELTPALAARSERVLSVDDDRQNVVAAASRTAHLSNVTVQRGTLPQDWPTNQRFDLVVLNDTGRSYEAADWADLVTRISRSLTDDATVLACHVKHGRAGQRLSAETLHGMLNSILGLPRQTKVADSDFIVDVWTTSARTIAQRDGLA